MVANLTQILNFKANFHQIKLVLPVNFLNTLFAGTFWTMVRITKFLPTSNMVFDQAEVVRHNKLPPLMTYYPLLTLNPKLTLPS